MLRPVVQVRISRTTTSRSGDCARGVGAVGLDGARGAERALDVGQVDHPQQKRAHHHRKRGEARAQQELARPLQRRGRTEAEADRSRDRHDLGPGGRVGQRARLDEPQQAPPALDEDDDGALQGGDLSRAVDGQVRRNDRRALDGKIDDVGPALSHLGVHSPLQPPCQAAEVAVAPLFGRILGRKVRKSRNVRMVEPLRKSESTWRGRGPSVATGAVLLALAVGACAAPEARGSGALARVAAGGELRWGADEQGGEPYAYEDPARGGALVGFEVALADALAESLGVRARMVQNDWSTLIPSLERGTFDVALNGIEVTPARAARVSFTRPYYLFAERLCARRGDGRIRDLSSLRGLRVGTLANTQAWDLLRAAGADAVPYEGVDEQFVDLEHGRTDAVLLDDIIVDRYLGRHPTLAAVADVAEGRYAIALRPADVELRAALDRTLGEMIASGAWQRTLARWGLDGDREQALGAGSGSPPATGLSAGASPAAASALPLTLPQLMLFA